MDTKLIVIAVFCLSVNRSASQGQMIADACYGVKIPQAINNLQCRQSLFICISEVRVYQWHNDDGCELIIPGPVQPHCCVHNATRCNRLMNEDGIAKLQRECVHKCSLHTGDDDRSVDSPCSLLMAGIVPLGNVRSIRYTCEQSQEASPATSSTSNSATKNSKSVPTALLNISDTSADTGVIVGGVLGGLVVVGIIVAIIIIYKRRVNRETKDNTIRVPAVEELSVSQQDRSGQSGYINVEFNESTAQPEGNFHSGLSHTEEDDNISVLYTKVNKNGRHMKITERQTSPDEYDHVQGESAKFPVIQHGDYDHVAMEDGDDEKSVNGNRTTYADSSSYDNLHRFSSKPGVVNDETYNRLHHLTAGNSISSCGPQNTSNYDYASIPVSDRQKSSNNANNSQQTITVYDIAKAI